MMILSGIDLAENESLATSMFRDRAKQFRDRLRWDVDVNEKGEEKDEYDLPDTIYVVVADDLGAHEGSMRLRPFTSPTMLSDHFPFLMPDDSLVGPSFWECTRFCISEKAPRKATALRLFGAGAKIMKEHDLKGLAGIFDPFMERIYRKYGVPPTVLGEASDEHSGTVKLGIWQNDELTHAWLDQRLKNRAANCDIAYSPTLAGKRFFH